MTAPLLKADSNETEYRTKQPMQCQSSSVRANREFECYLFCLLARKKKKEDLVGDEVRWRRKIEQRHQEEDVLEAQ